MIGRLRLINKHIFACFPSSDRLFWALNIHSAKQSMNYYAVDEGQHDMVSRLLKIKANEHANDKVKLIY